MMKKLLNGVLAVLIIVIVICLVGIMVLDSMGRTLVKTAGSEGLGVPVAVKSVHVGFFSNDSHLKEIQIANPEGFTNPNLLSIERADIVVVRFGEKYKQWNAAFDSGYAIGLSKSLIVEKT